MKFLPATLAAATLMSGAALADTVTIEAGAKFVTPSGGTSAIQTYHFVGPQDIVFEFAGKQCTLNGSARGSVPMGCNYLVGLDAGGTMYGTLVNGNAVCTQTKDVASSCN